jgi:dCTP deaminase
MTMLSDRDLFSLVMEQQIIEPFVPDHCQGATVNLTLDSLVKKYISKEPIVLGREVTEDHYQVIDLSKEDLWLQPNESILVQTHEFIKIPSHLSARIYERYSVKSLGLMISPAHYMNPGYRGQVGLVAVNHSPVAIRIVQGIKICQLALFSLSSEPLSPYENQDGKYMDARNVSISKLHLDKEIQEFLRDNGAQKVSDDMVKELGEHLMSHVRKSAKRLANILREEENNNSE